MGGARISYLVDTVGLSQAGAGQQVSDEFEEACGACGGSCFGEFSQVVSEQGAGVSRGILHSTMLYRVYAPSVSDAALSAASRGGGLGARIGFGCATLHQALRHLKARSF